MIIVQFVNKFLFSILVLMSHHLDTYVLLRLKVEQSTSKNQGSVTMVENASNVVVCHRVVRVFGTIPLVPPFYGARLRGYTKDWELWRKMIQTQEFMKGLLVIVPLVPRDTLFYGAKRGKLKNMWNTKAVEGNRNTWRKLPACCRLLTIFIT